MTKTPPKAPGVSTESADVKPPKTDWEAIERDYRTGVLSLREIGRQHGLSDTAIRKRAKDRGWTRDLTDKVREGVKAALVREEVRTSHARTDERELVAAAVDTCVALVRDHRTDLRLGRQMAEVLFGQLQAAAEHRELLEELIAEETAEDKTTQRRAALMRLVSLPTHAGVLRDLTVALKNLIPLERQAFNLDNLPPPEPPKPQEIPVDHERVLRLEARFGRYARPPVTIEQ